MKPSLSHPNPRGQSLLEFAISLTFLLILLSGAVDFGTALFEYIAMRDAAQEGAVYGSMNPTDLDGIRDRVRTASGPGFRNFTICVNYDDPIPNKCEEDPSSNPATCEGHEITVKVTYDHPISMPFLSAFIGNTITLNAVVTNTILTPPCP